MLDDVVDWGHPTGVHAGVCYLLTAVTPPSLRVRKPVSASGILALTRSPLLFGGRRSAGKSPAPSFGENRSLCRLLDVSGTEKAVFVLSGEEGSS